jgi:hypothetical protein
MNQKLYISSECQEILSTKNIVDVNRYFYNDVRKALNIFKWQAVSHITQIDSIELANYRIVSWYEYLFYCNSIYNKSLNRTVDNLWYITFDSDQQFNLAMRKLSPEKHYTWKRKYSEEDPGYEVTSRGDRRFSPFFQFYDIPNIGLIKGEDYYQKYIKPARADGAYVPGLGHKLIKDYLYNHPGLIYELALIGKDKNFTDMFDVNGGQNKWYAEFLNEYYFNKEYTI